MVFESVGTEKEVRPEDLKMLREQDGGVFILDCREPAEVATGAIAGSVNIPMSQLPARVNEIDSDCATVVVCHHGMRSLQVAAWLKKQAGFSQVKSLKGGMDAWSRQIDPSIPRY